MEQPNVFDEAVKGVDAIQHVASPSKFVGPDAPPSGTYQA